MFQLFRLSKSNRLSIKISITCYSDFREKPDAIGLENLYEDSLNLFLLLLLLNLISKVIYHLLIYTEVKIGCENILIQTI